MKNNKGFQINCTNSIKRKYSQEHSYIDNKKQDSTECIQLEKPEELEELEDISEEDLDENNNQKTLVMGLYPNKRILSKEEVTKIFIKLADKDISEKEKKELRDKIFVHNLKLVMSVAKKYILITKSFSYEDLCQTGIIGLSKAIDRYDYTLGFTFSTYAIWWIRQSIERDLSNLDALIRKPVHLVDKQYKLTKCREKYINEFGREPNKEDFLKYAKQHINSEIEMCDIEDYYILNPILISINDATENSEGTFRYDYINFASNELVDKKELLEDSVIRKGMSEYLIKEIQDILKPKEFNIIARRFGLFNDGFVESLASIGKDYGCSKENIRKMEERILKKIRKELKRKKITKENTRDLFG